MLHVLKPGHKMLIAAVLLAILTSVSLYFTLPDNNTVLYQNLTDEDKQEILVELSKMGADYKVEQDGSITVPKQDAAWVRSELTGMGLPSGGLSGEDILMQSSLGASEQDKKLKQIVGIRKQLEQDIVKNFDAIETANVQITLPEEESIFNSNASKGAAAVTVGVRRNQALTEQQILGIQYMISSAVSGVEAADVSVMDSKKGVISKGDGAANAFTSSSYEQELEMSQQVEGKIRSDIESTLVNIFKLNNFHVNTKVNMNYDEVTRQTETYGKDGVLRSKQESTERSVATDNGTATEAGVAANTEVPNYDEGNGNGTTDGNVLYDQNNGSKTENYEIDKTVETIKKHPELANTNVVVWVDDEALMKANVDMNAFRDAIATAAGLQKNPDGAFANGQVSIMQVPFDTTVAETKTDDTKQESNGINWWLMLGIGVPVLLASIGLTIFMMKRRKKTKEMEEVVEEEEHFLPDNVEELPAHREAASSILEVEDDFIPLDEQVQQATRENAEEAAKVLKKWLNG